MTLRVTLSIVPYGVEEDIYDIHTINISNLGSYPTQLDVYRYGVEVDEYKKPDVLDYKYVVSHKRDDGPLQLVMQALEKVLRNG